MDLSIYSSRDLQNMRAILGAAADAHADLATIASAVRQEMETRQTGMAVASPRPAHRRRPDNLTACQVCGSPAVIVSLAGADRTPNATHAIQCQNRPATDQPWREGMCGYTEYIVRGNS